MLCSNVPPHGTPFSKPLATVLTAVWFLSSVRPKMSDKTGLISKSFLAMVACVWFFSSVSPEMSYQVAGIISPIVTLVTLEFLHKAVFPWLFSTFFSC